MENINKTIGKNLLRLRKENKLTQLELAEKFNYSDKSISKWETGESLPSVEVLHELATFYNVTLNDLVAEEGQAPIQKETKTNLKMFPTRLIVTLLSVAAVWVVATAVFVCLKIFLDYSYPMCFLWATIPTFIVLVVFNSIWGRWRFLFPILSALLWSILVCLHIQFLMFNINLWPIYFIGVPLQVCIILWGALVKKPVWYNKQLKENKKQEKKVKKEEIKKQQQEMKKDA